LQSQPQVQIPALKPGQMLQGRYRIEIELGRGGFGAVYKAWDNNLNRWCAVKENLQVSPEAQRQFSREATVLANISHPNLPRVIDHFSIPGQGQYLVMDFVEGEDLASQSEHLDTFPLDQALKWANQVAEALVYLHSLEPPIFHRDIKPANIRITPRGKAMLVDFGLVKISDPHAQTTVGARAITPGYAPPEQYGRGSTDARTDVYALAATLYRLLTGAEPPESVQRLSGAALPLANQVNPAVPPYIARVIDRALSLDPDRRYQSAAEFKSALAEGQTVLVQGPPVPEGSRSMAAVPRTIAVESGEIAQPRPGSRPPPPSVARSPGRNSSQLLMLGGGVIIVILFVVAALGLVGWLVVSNQISSRATQQAGNTATVVAQVNATSTENARATANAADMLTQTAEAGYTATALANAALTAQAQATEAAFAAETATAAASQVLVLGPESGSLPHNPNDDVISLDEYSVSVTNFILEVRFDNPYSTSRGSWANGVSFFSSEDNQYRFVFDSDHSWELNHFISSDQDPVQIGSGDFSGIDTDANGSNLIRIVRQGDSGEIYINDEFVSTVDLSSWTDVVTIWIATGMYTGYEVTGASTDYQDLNVWSLP
jgi:serine/threonine protein kinase